MSCKKNECFYISDSPNAWICPYYSQNLVPSQQDCENCLRARELLKHMKGKK